MRTFITPNRKQKLLLTEVDLDSIAPLGSALRYIDELVEKLDTGGIEKSYDLECEQGRNPIHPKTFIKVGLYALYNCRFSLRKIQSDIEQHLGYKWLTGDRGIDHSTIGKFYARYIEQIVELFSQVVMICKEQDLIEFDLLAIDSVKVRADASYKQNKTLGGIEEEEQKIKKRLKELVEAASRGDSMREEEEKALSGRLKRLEGAKEVLTERLKAKAADKSGKEQKEAGKREKINITDCDAQVMQFANGERNPAYSVTTTTDTANDIITHFQINGQDDDGAGLMEAIEGSREKAGGRHEVVEADSGFASKENYKRLERESQGALIPDKRLEAEQRNGLTKGEYDRSKFVYDSKSDTYTCPRGKVLRKMGEATIHGRRCHRYGNRGACKGCEVRDACTAGKYRIISRDVNEGVQERMRAKLELEENRTKYHKRAHAAETPYGQVKRNLRFTHVMRRGKGKVGMEMALLFMLHNILKVAPLLVGCGA